MALPSASKKSLWPSLVSTSLEGAAEALAAAAEEELCACTAPCSAASLWASSLLRKIISSLVLRYAQWGLWLLLLLLPLPQVHCRRREAKKGKEGRIGGRKEVDKGRPFEKEGTHNNNST